MLGFDFMVWGVERLGTVSLAIGQVLWLEPPILRLKCGTSLYMSYSPMFLSLIGFRLQSTLN